MDPNEFDHRYSRDDVLDLVGAQVFSLIIVTFAAIAAGGAWFDAVLAHNQPLNYRYERIASVALGAFALYNALSLPARYSFIWSAPRARRRISSCLLQAAATGFIIAVAGLVLSAFRIDLSSGQSIVCLGGLWRSGCGGPAGLGRAWRLRAADDGARASGH